MTLEGFSKALDTIKFTRRVGFFSTLALTVYATMWSLNFPYDAVELGYSASEVAMVIGAVMSPVMMLMGFVINFYYSKGTVNHATAKEH